MDYRFPRNHEKLEPQEKLELYNALVNVGYAIHEESCFIDRNKSDGDIQVIKRRYFIERVYKKLGYAKEEKR